MAIKTDPTNSREHRALTVLAERKFSLENVKWFSDVSGDRNPLHVDPTYARRLYMGEVVIHGVYLLLWAIDSFYSHLKRLEGDENYALHKISAYFSRPAVLDENITVKQKEMNEFGEVRLELHQQEERIATFLLTFGPEHFNSPKVTVCKNLAPLLSPEFGNVKEASGEAEVCGDSQVITATFPDLVKSFGIFRICGLLAISRLVGMECPGLHSLLSNIEIGMYSEEFLSPITWQVARHTIAQAPIRLTIHGGGIEGHVDAFFRPHPVSQPTIAEVSKRVELGVFSQQTALIVGGSRGIGELTAKILAAGGAEVIITYNRGEQDAVRVCDEISDVTNRSCRVIQMDSLNVSKAIDLMQREAITPTHVYYFASPKISRSRGTSFDKDLFEMYCSFYVSAFEDLLRKLRATIEGPLAIFYPSTIYIDHTPKGLAEYAAAKAAGEAVVKNLGATLSDITIVHERLPALPTDQNSAIIPVKTAEPITELLAVTHKMYDVSIKKNNK